MDRISYTIERQKNTGKEILYTAHRNDGTSIPDLHPSEVHSLTAFKEFADRIVEICVKDLKTDIPEKAVMFGDEVQDYLFAKLGPLYQKGLNDLNDLAEEN